MILEGSGEALSAAFMTGYKENNFIICFAKCKNIIKSGTFIFMSKDIEHFNFLFGSKNQKSSVLEDFLQHRAFYLIFTS